MQDNNPDEESIINATLPGNVSAGPTHKYVEILKSGSQKGHSALYLLYYCYKYTKDKKCTMVQNYRGIIVCAIT